MNRILISFLIFCSISSGLFAQDKNLIKHKVAKGETVNQIATKYRVTPYDIYQLNPDSQNGINENDIILVPTAFTNEKQSPNAGKANSTISHLVKQKETIYSIARDYNMDVVDLKNLNAEIFKNGLKVGQTIEIPSSKGVTVPEVK